MKTFKELFAGTGIEPTTDENGGVDYNFKATLKEPMKTAMQELLENLQKSFDEKTYPIKIDATYFLEKEKEQIRQINELSLTPIELPSDEEIEQEAYYKVSDPTENPYASFKSGAKWIKEQILNQNK